MTNLAQSKHSWKSWYLIPTENLAVALREAREAAHRDHPDTSIARMMTPSVREVPQGTRVFVVGKPD